MDTKYILLIIFIFITVLNSWSLLICRNKKKSVCYTKMNPYNFLVYTHCHVVSIFPSCIARMLNLLLVSKRMSYFISSIAYTGWMWYSNILSLFVQILQIECCERYIRQMVVELPETSHRIYNDAMLIKIYWEYRKADAADILRERLQ